MASPNSSWSDILTTTLNSRTKKLADNVTDNVSLYMRLKEKGRVRTISCGASILQELEYAESTNVMWYNGYEPLAINPQELFTAADFALKLAACGITISGTEMLQNTGPERQINLLRSRVGNAEKSMTNLMGAGVYSDGTAYSGKQIGGLQLLVADTNTNTVGGISGSTYDWWRNVVFDLSSLGSVASSTNIQGFMNRTYTQLVRNTDAPDLILTDNVYYTAYLGSLQTIQRVTNDKMASAGFQTLKYMGADVVLDGGRGGNCPASHMYFLNTDYIFLRPHAERNMVPLDPDRFSVNQDALVKFIGWAGNMTTSNRFLQGVLKA